MKYGNSSNWRRFLNSPITLIGLLIIFVILAKAAWGSHNKAELSYTKLSNAQIELGKLEAHQKALAGEIGRLSTDQGVEAELRTKYRAVKEGESVAVIIEDKASTTSVILAPIVTSTGNIGWWGRVLRVVGF